MADIKAPTPLTHWTCDVCGEGITDPNSGLVVWRRGVNLSHYGFKVVHKSIGGLDCDSGAAAGYTSNLDISAFLGEEGQARLLAFLRPGPLISDREGTSRTHVEDTDEYVDLFRRFQTPWYEEARQKWDDSETQQKVADANEVYPYIPDVLVRVARGQLD